MYNDVLDVRKALYDIETAPAQMYEKLMKSDPYKLSISMVSGIASGMTSRYAKAIDTYETTGTKVREDLDDSIIKAVNNSAEGIMDELLLGEDVMGVIASKRVIVFGVGGVGSWCVECLVRSGIRRITIVDSDCVCLSNVNRQLMATTKTVGRPKVEALKERLLEINPECEVTAIQKIFTEERASEFCLDEYDYIVDAIDSLKDKAALILLACQTRAVLFSSMGAALKMDPTRIRVAEFWKVRGCPLGAALRKRMKRAKTIPAHKFQCVYSEELLENRGTDTGDDPCSFQKAQINGSMSHITAIFGFTIAGLVLDDIYRKALNK